MKERAFLQLAKKKVKPHSINKTKITLWSSLMQVATISFRDSCSFEFFNGCMLPLAGMDSIISDETFPWGQFNIPLLYYKIFVNNST